MAFLAAIAFLALVFVIAYGISEWFLGPEKPPTVRWYPADPEPGARRRPCLDASCRIDHDVSESERRLMDGNR